MMSSRAPLKSAVLAALFVAAPAIARSAATDPSPSSVALIVLADTSGSISGKDQEMRRQLVEDVARGLPAGSEVAVFAFDDAPRLLLPWTRNADEVARVAAELKSGGRFTALNDAIFDAVRYHAQGSGGRRAILLITDGLDENSALNPEDGANEAREQRIPVFCIGIGRVQEHPMRRIAKLTGGDYFGAATPGADVVARIATVASPPPPRRAAAVELSAPAPRAVSDAVALAPAAKSVAPAASNWPAWAGVGFAALAVVMAVGFVMLRRSDRAAPPPAAPAEPFDSQEDATLITRLENLEQPDSPTLVLTLKPLLHVTRGPNNGKFYEVSLDTATSIGRAKGNDVTLDDRAVSSQHCRIRRSDSGVFEIVDLKSTNGTFVNERRITRQNLGAGDVIKAGETLMQFRMDHMKQ